MTKKPLEMTKIARNDENISKNKADHISTECGEAEVSL